MTIISRCTRCNRRDVLAIISDPKATQEEFAELETVSQSACCRSCGDLNVEVQLLDLFNQRVDPLVKG